MFLTRSQKTPWSAQKGFSHHFILPVLAIMAVGSIGAYLTFGSKAATPSITSGKMAYTISYADDNQPTYRASITSDGRNETPLIDTNSSKVILDRSWGNQWFLVSEVADGKLYYYAYTSDFKNRVAYSGIETPLACSGEPTKYGNKVAFVQSAATTRPPRLAVIRVQYDCNAHDSLNTRIFTVEADGTNKKELLYDSRDGVSYNLGIGSVALNNGALTADGSMLLDRDIPTGDNTSKREPLFLSNTGTLVSLAGKHCNYGVITRTTNRIICSGDLTSPYYTVRDTNGKLLSTTTVKSESGSDYVNEVMAVNNTGTKILFRHWPYSSASTHNEQLFVYDIATKRTTTLDSGEQTRKDNYYKSVFEYAYFSASDSFIGYTKNDYKYKSLSIRRIRVDGTSRLTTKSFTYRGSYSNLQLLW